MARVGGRLPLHVGAMNASFCSLSALQHLWEQYPPALRLRCSSANISHDGNNDDNEDDDRREKNDASSCPLYPFQLAALPRATPRNIQKGDSGSSSTGPDGENLEEQWTKCQELQQLSVIFALLLQTPDLVPSSLPLRPNPNA